MSKEIKTTQEVTKEDIEKMSEIIAEEVIAIAIENDDNSEIREIITCKNIQMGEKVLNEFNGVVRLTRFIEKQGRTLSYKELEKEMPVMFEALDNIEGNPMDVIKKDKSFTADLTVASNEVKAMRRLEATLKVVKAKQGEGAAELVEKAQKEQREAMKAEIKKVESEGVDWDEQIVFDIWMIRRAERQRRYMESEKLPVDYLIKLYSYIPKAEFDKLKEYYRSTFE